jgi:hypothetical protein
MFAINDKGMRVYRFPFFAFVQNNELRIEESRT